MKRLYARSGSNVGACLRKKYAGDGMSAVSLDEMCLVSRALERVLRAMPDKSRLQMTTADLADAVLEAVAEGARGEAAIAETALAKLRTLSPALAQRPLRLDQVVGRIPEP